MSVLYQAHTCYQDNYQDKRPLNEDLMVQQNVLKITSSTHAETRDRTSELATKLAAGPCGA